MMMFSLSLVIICTDAEFGNGTLGYRAIAACDSNKDGEKTAVCKANGRFEDREDSCVLRPILSLFNESEVTCRFSHVVKESTIYVFINMHEINWTLIFHIHHHPSSIQL